MLRKYKCEKLIILSFTMIMILSCCNLPNLPQTPSTEISPKPGAEIELIRSPAPILHSTAPHMKLIPISIHKSGSDIKVKFALQNDSDDWYTYTISPIESIYLETADGTTYPATDGSLNSHFFIPPGFTIRGDPWEDLYLAFQVAEGTSGYKVIIPSYTATDGEEKSHLIDVPLEIDLEKEVHISRYPFETPRLALRTVGDQIELPEIAILRINDVHMTGLDLNVNYTIQNLSGTNETTVLMGSSIIGEDGLRRWGEPMDVIGGDGLFNIGPAQVSKEQLTAEVPMGGHYYLILTLSDYTHGVTPFSHSYREVVDLGMFAYPTTLSFVVLTKVTKGFTIDQELQIITSTIPLDIINYPVLSGLPSKGGCIPKSVFDFDYIKNTFRGIYIESSNGNQKTKKVSLDELAIRPGTSGKEPLLAWGTYPDTTQSDNPSYLNISNLDGSQIVTLYTLTSSDEYPMRIVVDSWSADGNAIYFSKIMSNIIMSRFYKPAPNLYKIDVRTMEVTDVLGEVSDPNSFPYYLPYYCIDTISRDNRYVADHCTPGIITVHDIQRNQSTAIQIPLDIPPFSEYVIVDTALFNPSGDRVAFGMGQWNSANPDEQHTWIAVGDSSGGYANVILESNDDGIYYLLGWLNDQTLLVQFVSDCRECHDQIYTIDANGSNLTQWAIGTLVTVLDCNAATSPSNAVLFKEPTATPTEIASLPAGNTVPDFSLDTFDGQTIRLSDQKGKIVLLNFWASWAVPCKREAPILQAAWEYYKPHGDVIFIGINLDNIYYKDDVLQFINKYGITYPNGNDIEQLISQQFRLMGVPETYIIDKNGNLSFDNIYPFSSVDDIKAVIDPLLQP